MQPLPSLVRVLPAGGVGHATIRSRPRADSEPLGEAPGGLPFQPLAATVDGAWLAVPWSGGTGWVARAEVAPLRGAVTEGSLPFDWPVGPAEARALDGVPPGWYVAVGFAEAYEPSRGRRAIHTGLDLNLRRGGDSDLGLPVYATADGVVTASSVWPVWGNIVLLRHALPDGGTLWSQYAHLGRRLVRRGQAVQRGEQIGTIGKGQGNRFSAHLHFELRTRDLPASHWPGLDRAAVLAGYADPRAVLAQARPGAAAVEPGPAPWSGKGLFVRAPWPLSGVQAEAAGRSWRAAGLRFVVLKLAHHDRPYLPATAPWRSAHIGHDGPALWGWGTVLGERPLRELALAGEGAADLAAVGWVVQPDGGYPIAGVDAFMAALRATLGERVLAVAWPIDAAGAAIERFATWADVLMPIVSEVGAVGRALALTATYGPPVVPVLRDRTPDAAGTAAAFLAHAAASGRPGAATMSDDHWAMPVGTAVDDWLASAQWPPDDDGPLPAHAAPTSTRSTQDQEA